ncbi:hypothetical protein JHK87_049889 [Glycine soja]|nr:hypothetical protein JHK87_049889 [Glycine soja]
MTFIAMAKACKSQEEIASEATKHDLKALKKRHLLEEASHAPVWKEKVENLQVELQQCYKAQSRLFKQLIVEVAESRA